MTARVPGRASRWAAAARSAARSAATRALTPHKAAIGNLAAMPLTVAGAACVDFAAWHLGHGWGWLVTGVTLVLVEHVIADER